MVTVSLYARVSSGRQAQEDTIASQIAAIENQISMDGHKLLNEYKFIDNGYSGSNIIRPGLEKLRDKIAEGNIDKVYIHSPDRLSRKYAYQMILLEEFKKLGVEVIFLNYQISDNPESQLLLQMQGMIAEYERAKIMERSRRGKIYAANKGCISVMSAAPYGYRYINKNTETGQALFEIYEEEAEVVRKVFSWVGRERASIGEVCRRLSAISIMTRTGKEYWDRAVVLSMLKNTAYKGQAAFGKTRFGVKLKHIRPKKNSCEHPKDNYSTYPVPKEDWIYIKVPSIVSEDLFEIVQEQLAENRKIARTRQRGAKHLLQGLVVCKLCNYAYYGTSTARNKEGKKTNNQVYYRCIGTDSYRFGGNKMCNNKLIRTDTLDMAVWEEVKHLLKNPNRILEEYKRRLSELKKSPLDQKSALLETQEDKLKRGIARLIDSYAQEYIDQEEFEPRVKAMKQNLKMVEEQKKKIFDQKKLTQELTLVVTNLEGFSSSINSSLNNADWLTKRDIIRTLVKRIEINFEDVNIVFRVKELPDSFHMEKNQCLQCCCRGRYDGSWRHDVEPTLTIETKRRIIMSTIILSSIFGQAGSIFGPIGQIIGSELGALLGAQLDGAMFSLDAEQKVTHGARLKNLQVQTSTYGRTIPIIYGTARIAGNIIWSQPIKEEAITTKSKIGRGMNVEYNYYATLAIAICKGKVEKLNRIWADTTSLSFDEIDYTFYRGTEDQNPDPFMSSIEGVPAYRGISYIVIKNFPLADYNNRVPVFTFEVQTILKPSGFSVVENIQNINIIPGSGEFVYDTKIQKKIAQEKISSNQYIPYGLAQRVNHNNHTKKSDAVLSLDQLKGDLPNVEWVSVVVNWFVNDLNIKDCKIYPAVEFQDDSAILPDDWQVGSSTRDDAQLISKDDNGNPRYGGTVSDSALIRYIEELHSRGYKVMLYPMPLLDTKNKEWRGRLSGAPQDISDFFKNQYNKFIEHYASIAKQTKVEGFIIGSEFVELTKIRDEKGNYPAVAELVKLAKQIKLDLGKEVTVTYAADWSEYHSYDGWYNMDELWSSQYIDVVGIDAYFPLTDGPEPPFGYSAEDVMGGWSSGVGYDYFYDYSKSEPEKVKYNDSRYAWKNIEKWWSETHINPGGSKTKWQPKMKKNMVY